MNCVVLQPTYIPWRGVFHLMQKADIFVFYDDVQYEKHGWQNRNRIKTAQGTQWITIPVSAKGATTEHKQVREIPIVWTQPWSQKHWQSIQMSYSKAPYFKKYAPLVESFYTRRDERLADFTCETAQLLAHELGIRSTRFLRSSTLGATGAKTDRLLSLLGPLGATRYISGPAAKAYIEPEKFEAAGIQLEYMVYDYPEYTQLHGDYDPYVSILDLLFMTGERAPELIWGSNSR